MLRIGPLVGDFEESQTPSNELAIIMHGLGGHRDYCYQKRLGTALTKIGFNTFRFDFRSCGDSDDVPDLKVGRSIHGTDYEDLDRVYRHFSSKGYKVTCMIGHSRSVACMFSWQLRNPDIFIPYFVNCSGRYDCMKVYDRLAIFPDMFKDKGYIQPAKRYGKTQELWCALPEVEEYAKCHSKEYANINPMSQVLTIFGLKDHIVPVQDAGEWANMMGERGTLEMIEDADHNFYGKVDGKHVNYNPIVVEKICAWLSPEAQLQRWYKATTSSNSSRWHEVEGVANFRDFGGYDKAPSSRLFRCAALNNITETGKKQIQALGITDIFDLRSTSELKRDKTQPVSIDGINTHFVPIFEVEDWSPQGIAERQKALEKGGLLGSYVEILDAAISSGSFAKIVKCITQGGSVLVHCTAGKDRTGIICAMILLGFGVDDYTIAREYELTTIGYAAQREKLSNVLGRFLDKATVDRMLESRYETMYDAIQYVKQHYGSISEYYKLAGLQNEYQQLSAARNTRNAAML